MFVRNFNPKNEDFVCLRVDQISILIFQMVYLRYLKHHADLEELIYGFLEAFFVAKKDLYQQRIYFNLFRSFYSFHFHLFLKFDQDFINNLIFLLADLRDKNNREFLIRDFYKLYSRIIKDIDDFNLGKNRKYKQDIELALKDIDEIAKDTSIFILMYAVHKVEGLIKLIPVGDILAELLQGKISKLNDKIKNSVNGFLNEKENEFIDKFNFSLDNKNYNVSTVDIANMYQMIKQNANDNDDCVICDNISLTDYFVNIDQFDTSKDLI